MNEADTMYKWASDLFPIPRSIMGPAFRKSLDYICKIIPQFKIRSIPTGENVFDWVVPDEWELISAKVFDSDGNTLIDSDHNNLHVVGYSVPFKGWLSLENLKQRIYSLPDNPEAIPYVTSYYERDWGLCLTDLQLHSLTDQEYFVEINTRLYPGQLNYAELVIPGKYTDEVFISTYLCHPSMANNELSGPVVATALAKWLLEIDNKFTYRIVILPETIGSIAYISKNMEVMPRIIAAFNLTCVGDNRTYSFLPSRDGNTLADRVAKYVLKTQKLEYQEYSFLERGSDERQYCWPGIDLPMVSVMRSKYGTYPEYHTSKDDLNLISPEGLFGSLELHKKMIVALENNGCYKPLVTCEPFLRSRNLYPKTSTLEPKKYSRDILNFMTYCDGKKDFIEICTLINMNVNDGVHILNMLKELKLVELVDNYS